MICVNRKICDECEYRKNISECPILNEEEVDGIKAKTVVRFIAICVLLIIFLILI